MTRPSRERSDTDDAAPRHRRGHLPARAGRRRPRRRSDPWARSSRRRPVDGPSPDIRAVGDVDVARDGAGLLTSRRRDGGEDHVFASLIDGGIPQGAFRVDGGQGPLHRPARRRDRERRPHGDRVRQRRAASGSRSARRPGRPSAAAAARRRPGATDPSIDLSINGAGYMAWAQGGDVRSALPGARRDRVRRRIPTALDPDPARDAGTGAGAAPARHRVGGRHRRSSPGASATAPASTHVVVRRLVRDRVSAVAAEANAATIDGLAGGSADMPDVVVRGRLELRLGRLPPAGDRRPGRRRRCARIARRLRGSGFDDPATIDGGARARARTPSRGSASTGAGRASRRSRRPAARSASIVKDDVAHAVARSSAAPRPCPSQPVAGLRRELRRRRRLAPAAAPATRSRRAAACWRTTSRSRSRRRSGPTCCSPTRRSAPSSPPPVSTPTSRAPATR